MTTDKVLREPGQLIADKFASFENGFFSQLPNIIVAAVFLLAAFLAGRLLAAAIARIAVRRGRPDLGALLGSLAKGVFRIAAVLFAAAIVFPSVKPGDVFAALGIGSVAIGFAFKDILQNLMAGLLLLIRRPYRRGDQIIVKEFEGTVERIETRATIIRTYDGRQVIIPNSDVYTSAVTVNTAHDKRRDEFVIGIGYGDDPSKAIELFTAAIAKVEGVLADPPPEVLPHALNDSTVDLQARWWALSPKSDQTHVRARVVLAVYEEAKKHGIDLPFPTQVMLFHDQTEEADGDRSRQREGWPTDEAAPIGSARRKKRA